VRAIDANVILRFVTADHPEMSLRCRELFGRVQRGEETVFLPEAALSDVVWTLRSYYRWPVAQTSGFVGDLLAMDGIHMTRKEVIWEALSLFAAGGLDFSDALIVAEMRAATLEELYSYDHDFDRVEAVTRLEP
jgi:predicted nucleic acid-binding protein